MITIPNLQDSYHGCFGLGDAPYGPNSRFHPHGWKPVLGNKRKEGKGQGKGHKVNITSETSKFENLKQRKGQRKVSNPARSAFVGVAANEPRFTRGNSFSKPPKAKLPRHHQRQVTQSRKQRRQRRERSRSPPRRKEESIEELTLLLHGFDAHQAFTETAGQSINKAWRKRSFRSKIPSRNWKSSENTKTNC